MNFLPLLSVTVLVFGIHASQALDLIIHADSSHRIPLNGGFDSLTFDHSGAGQPALVVHAPTGIRKLGIRDIDSMSIRPSPSTPDTGGAQLGSNWIHVGDSQTDGRAPEPMRSPGAVFRAIWQATFTSPSAVAIKGVGGIPLSATMDMYTGMGDLGKATWVHFQESGFQDEPGQRTAAEFAATFEAMVRRIRRDSPDALISTETAYSFQRENEPFRNWTEYNTALRAKVVALREEGIAIHLAETDRNIKDLVTALGFSVPILPDGGHYTSVGNLMVALSYFDALGYDVGKVNLDGLTAVTEAQKQACLNVIAKY